MLVAQLIELLMTCILYVLLCGELMVGVFPSAPLDLTAWILAGLVDTRGSPRSTAWILISGVVLLPCALLRSLRHVAWLSFWCTPADPSLATQSRSSKWNRQKVTVRNWLHHS